MLTPTSGYHPAPQKRAAVGGDSGICCIVVVVVIDKWSNTRHFLPCPSKMVLGARKTHWRCAIAFWIWNCLQQIHPEEQKTPHRTWQFRFAAPGLVKGDPAPQGRRAGLPIRHTPLEAAGGGTVRVVPFAIRPGLTSSARPYKRPVEGACTNEKEIHQHQGRPI